MATKGKEQADEKPATTERTVDGSEAVFRDQEVGPGTDSRPVSDIGTPNPTEPTD